MTNSALTKMKHSPWFWQALQVFKKSCFFLCRGKVRNVRFKIKQKTAFQAKWKIGTNIEFAKNENKQRN